jgi:hypothetical protein
MKQTAVKILDWVLRRFDDYNSDFKINGGI